MSAGDERARMFATRFCRLVSVLSQSSAPVATTSGQKSVNVCPPPKNALPLPLQTRSLTIKKYKIMTQMNEMSARALSMEELENVNGGRVNRRKLTHRTIGY